MRQELERRDKILSESSVALERRGLRESSMMFTFQDELRNMRDKLEKEEKQKQEHYVESVAERQKRLDVDLHLARLQAELAAAQAPAQVGGCPDSAAWATCMSMCERAAGWVKEEQDAIQRVRAERDYATSEHVSMQEQVRLL